jgi:ribonuclease P protein component
VPKNSFTKSERLLKPAEFIGVIKSGRRTQTESFRVTVLPNTLGKDRLGISISAKVAGSVTRSRIKRLIREFFRLNKGAVKGGRGEEGMGVAKGAEEPTNQTTLDIVVSVKRVDLIKGLKEVEDELKPVIFALKRSGAKGPKGATGATGAQGV